MRRRTLVLCVLMMLFLSACGADRTGELLDEITARYAASPAFDARIAARLELTDRTADYVIDWQFRDGQSTLTVAEPEEIAGIRCMTDDAGLHFQYEGAVLTVDPDGEALSPLEALPQLCFGWSGGQVEDCCRETRQDMETLAVTYSHQRGGADEVQRVWFDTQRLTPVYAEISENGKLVLACEFLLFQLN